MCVCVREHTGSFKSILWHSLNQTNKHTRRVFCAFLPPRPFTSRQKRKNICHRSPHLVNLGYFPLVVRAPQHSFFSCFLLSKLNWEHGGDPRVRRAKQPRVYGPACLSAGDRQSEPERKKQLKVSNRLSTCHETTKKVSIVLQATLIHEQR